MTFKSAVERFFLYLGRTLIVCCLPFGFYLAFTLGATFNALLSFPPTINVNAEFDSYVSDHSIELEPGEYERLVQISKVSKLLTKFKIKRNYYYLYIGEPGFTYILYQSDKRDYLFVAPLPYEFPCSLDYYLFFSCDGGSVELDFENKAVNISHKASRHLSWKHGVQRLVPHPIDQRPYELWR